MKIKALLPLSGKRHSHEKFVRERLIPIVQKHGNMEKEIPDEHADAFCLGLGVTVTEIMKRQTRIGTEEVEKLLEHAANSLAAKLNELATGPSQLS